MSHTQHCTIAGKTIRVHTYQTIVVGSGAAGMNCAEHLFEMGVEDIAIVTDRLGAGTSNNSGSDKQTYYKLGIFGDVADSPMEFARVLTAGGMMHGDIAYAEALGSAPEFFHLVRNGVPFPHNRFGAYVGYKTDHDPRQRATSAGPKTSNFMFAKSLQQVRRNGTPIFDRHAVVALLTADEGERKRVVGALAIDLERAGERPLDALVLFHVENIVFATGGPGEMYHSSVYPCGQSGSHGLALEIGAVANNLTESQYGLASTRFRWNLSGTYQQVIPCYFSTDPLGGERRYFLNDYYPTMKALASNTFLKGYQWPFHAARLQGLGSSLVDIAVHNEIAAGRHVYIDFMTNPQSTGGLEPFSLENLEPEAGEYLKRSGAVQATPYERLEHMNPESIALYAERGIDLREPLAVAVCAQHNNGGLRGNVWWESNIKHLFPIGEINGSHGVRPGGSALNSGQVGGLRAAQYIKNVYHQPPMPLEAFLDTVRPRVEEKLGRMESLLAGSADAQPANAVRREIQQRMSAYGAFLRSADGVAEALRGGRKLWRRIQTDGMRLDSPKDLPAALENEALCLSHLAFLQAIQAYIQRGGGSRGAFMILDDAGDLVVDSRKGPMLRHRSENLAMRQEILEVVLAGDGEFRIAAVPVRPLPDDQSWYETTWRDWLEGRVYEP